MNIEELRLYCLSKKAVTESFPFDEEALVFKVLDKMFLLTNITGELRMNIKCDPERAVELREEYSSVLPGYHMNKKHWNTLTLDGTLGPDQVTELIQHSYDLVVQGLSKKDQKKVKEASSTPLEEEKNWRAEFLRDMSE